jgi:hypothetical protein
MKKRLFLFFFLLLSPFIVGLSLTPFTKGAGGSFTIYALQDTIISEYLPDYQGWTTTTPLQMGRDTTIPEDKRGFFQFNLSSAYMGSITITSVTLYVYCPSQAYGGNAYYTCRSIDPSNETWDDNTITWNNSPTRYTFEESSGITVSATATFYSWSMVAGNSTQGIGAVQDAYDNNRSKTYVLASTATYAVHNWNSIDAGSNRPRLYVTYTVAYAGEYTEEAPELTNPRIYQFKYYPKNDSTVNNIAPTTNYGTQNISQIQYSASGIVSDILVKFDLRVPDTIDDNNNTNLYSLASTPFDILEMYFYQYCNFAPDPPFQAFNYLSGIYRSNETWTETGVNWNNKPTYRDDIITTAQEITDDTTYIRYDLATEENYIRYSVQNEYNYTVVHRVRFNMTTGFNEWRMREYNTSKPYIVMNVALDELAIAYPDYLTFTTAHYYLAISLDVTPFIAGHLLTAIFCTVLFLGVAMCTRNKFILTSVFVACMTVSLLFGWLHIGVYALLLITTLILAGGLFKKWV